MNLKNKVKPIKLENTYEQLKKIHGIENLSLTIKELINCKIKYKASFQDYFFFGMSSLNTLQRKSLVLKGINRDYILKYNIQKYINPFLDIELFYKSFTKYMNRECLIINGNNKKEFAIFCQNHPIFFAESKKRTKIRRKITTDLTKLKDLYEELLENHFTLISEPITGHEDLQKLHPKSLNTITIVTLLGSIVASYINIGNNNINTDNFHYGGLIAPIDIKTGVVNAPAMNIKKELFELHPTTNEKINNIKIPLWDELLKIIDEICLEIPQIGYVSWNFAISQDKIYLLTSNAYPDHLIYAHPKVKIGKLTTFHQAEERKFEE